MVGHIISDGAKDMGVLHFADPKYAANIYIGIAMGRFNNK